MKVLHYLLLAEGTSDRAFLPILDWLLRQNGLTAEIRREIVDKLRLPERPPRCPLSPLAWRIQQSLMAYSCDLLFVHRDADRERKEERFEEIRAAHQEVANYAGHPVVCVVPVRMQETWLLFDEAAIRYASGNPAGKMNLLLPKMHELERKADPKSILQNALREASGLTGRRLQQTNLSPQRVVEAIEDFSPLRRLSAFQALEAEIKATLEAQDWA